MESTSHIKQVCSLLFDFLQEFRKNVACTQKGEHSFAQVLVLKHIQKLQHPAMKDLAAKIGIRHASISLMIDQLMRKGLVEKISDATDHRVVRIGLTKIGNTVLKDAQRVREQYMMSLLQVVSKKDLDTLRRILLTLTEEVSKAPSRKLTHSTSYTPLSS